MASDKDRSAAFGIDETVAETSEECDAHEPFNFQHCA